MLEKLKQLFRRYYDLIVYLVFGVLTTVVNYLVYLPCYNILHLSSSASNVVAWVFAVIFAYLTNKPFVFRSLDWSAKTVVPELLKFVGSRMGSGGAETLFLFVAVDLMALDGNWCKLIASVAVVVLNYVSSKLLVFRKL